MSTIKALLKIQADLKTPKGQWNDFSKFNYRSLEDICAAVKPLTVENNCIFTLSDQVELIGDRYYIKATATIQAVEGEPIAVTAYAREALTKKGMDDSQLSGSCSSYARKYACNGLFCIDDTKDADSMDHRETKKQAPKKEQASTIYANLDLKLSDFSDYAEASAWINNTTNIEYFKESLSPDELKQWSARCKSYLNSLRD